MSYHVYACYVDDVVKYVGYGKKQRYKHCQSGKSSSVLLNKAFFQNKKMETVLVFQDLTKEEAELREAMIIDEIGLENLYNISNPMFSDKTESKKIQKIKSFLDDLYENIINIEDLSVTKIRNVIFKTSTEHNNPVIISTHTSQKIDNLLAFFDCFKRDKTTKKIRWIKEKSLTRPKKLFINSLIAKIIPI